MWLQSSLWWAVRMAILLAVIVALMVGLAIGDAAGGFALALVAAMWVKLTQLSAEVRRLRQGIEQSDQALQQSSQQPAQQTAQRSIEPPDQQHMPSGPEVDQKPDGVESSEPDTPADHERHQEQATDPYGQPLSTPFISSAAKPAGTATVVSNSASPSEANSGLSATASDVHSHQPDWLQRLKQTPLADWFLRINIIARFGIVILFFGLSFLVKYTAEHISVPIELRLMGISLFALAVFAVGWKLRQRKREYALLLQGAAVGCWYLVTFAAMKIYPLIPVELGFVLLFFLSVFAAFMSIIQDAPALAVFGILGGFMAPVLASTGSGSHVVLFSYYGFLNAGILAIVWFKAWRPLSLLGFVFTFIISVIWGVTEYNAELFATTEPFLLLFMAFYIAIVMLFALRKRWPPQAKIDAPILFGTPAIGFSLQSLLVENIPCGMAFSAFGFGLVYLLITAVWWRPLAERAPLLREAFIAIGVTLLTLSVPYAFELNVTALIWSLESAGAIWLATRLQRNWAAILALLMQVGAGLSLLLDSPSAGQTVFFNVGYLGCAAVALAAFWSAWLLRQQPQTFWVRLAHLPILIWSLGWWFVAAFWQLQSHLSDAYLAPTYLIFVSLSLAAINYLRMRWQWQALAPVPLALLPLASLCVLMHPYLANHLFAALGYVAWPLVMLVSYWLYNSKGFFSGRLHQFEKPWHMGTYLLAVLVAVLEVCWQVRALTPVDSWELIAAGVVLLISVVVISTWRFWPHHLTSLYRLDVTAILLAALLVNFIWACLIEPVVSPFPYWPILNVLDLWQITILVFTARWWQSVRADLEPPELVKAGDWWVPALAFIYLNTLMFRIIYLAADVEFALLPLLQLDVIQTGISILWASVGAILLMLANNRGQRNLWLVGISLIAIIVVKLFLVDLSNSGTVARIVSFMVVGLLLLAVGYLMPIPDRKEKNEYEVY